MLVIGAGALVGGGAILYYRHQQNAAAAATPAAGTDTSGYDTSGDIDPTTGIPYADEGAGMDGAYGTTPSALGYYDPTTGQYIGTGVGTSTVTTVSTNAAWAQAAAAYLVNQGYDGATVTAAIGLYLLGAPLTQDQYDIVTAAIGFEGNPPQGAPPPHMASGGGGTGQSGGGGTTTGTTVKVTVPITFGMSANTALTKMRAAGFAADTSPVRDPKNTYVSTGSSPRGGSKAAKGSHVTINVKVLKRG